MAVVYADFVRDRSKAVRSVRTHRARTERAKAYQRATAAAVSHVQTTTQARQGGAAFWMIMLLAPLAGLIAPLMAGSMMTATQGYALAGAGLVVCLLLMLRLLKQEANHAMAHGK